MRVAVLGASGFIGGRIVEMLHLGGLASVRPVVRRASGLARSARFDLEGRVADGLDVAALTAAFRDCDVLVHAVAGSPATIVGMIRPTYDAAQAAGVRRLIYLSTASVHGQSPAPGTDERSPLSERQPLPYNNAKVRAERDLLRHRRTGKTEVVILRPGIVYGPRSYWISSFADALLAGSAYLVGGGIGICNGIYVDNLVHAIHLAATATSPGVDGEAFLVGDREQITWADFYRPIATALGFSLDAVPSVDSRAATVSGANWWERLNSAKDTAVARAALDRLPARLRYTVYSALGAWHSFRPPSPQRATSPPAAASPVPTREMALLQSCRYKLPSGRAESALGYDPPVTFAEGMRRSVGWLAFAGYPVVETIATAEQNESVATAIPRAT